MNAIDKVAAVAARPPAATVYPRIRYIDPLAVSGVLSGASMGGAGLDASLEQAASLGFTAVMTPPPWAPGADGDRFFPATRHRVHAGLGGGSIDEYARGFAQRCRQHGLAAMFDLPVGAVASEFEGDAGPFAAAPHSDALDPRHATGRVRIAADPAGLGAWWGDHLARLAASGIAGVRVLGLEHAPAALSALRQAVPDMVLIAWTPGMPREALAALSGASFVVSSLPWWDFRSDWFWDELSELRRIAPVLACPEAPFAIRAAAAVHDPARVASTLRRLAGFACAIGDGWLVPDGFETGARRPFTALGRYSSQTDRVLPNGMNLAELNQRMSSAGPVAGSALVSGAGASVLALLRTDTFDARFAAKAVLTLVNVELDRARSVDPASVLANVEGEFQPFAPLQDGGKTLLPGVKVTLAPGEVQMFAAQAAAAKPAASGKLDGAAARRFADGPRVAIEAVSPCVDDGSLPVKRLMNEVVTVEADVICDGHDKLGVALQWREPGGAQHEIRMQPAGNDRYQADLPLTCLGAYSFTIQAWRDAFASYKDEIAKKSAAGVDVTLELREGMALLTRTADRSQGEVKKAVQAIIAELEPSDDPGKLARFLSPELSTLMAAADDRPRAATLPQPVRIDAERSGAAFAAWYEVFPRSLSDDASRHGTFRDVERHLPRVKAMGFDVLYFPPIHPIGRINRKGPNNTLTPAEGDPGSPYAIGSVEGGHDALHPELGTLEDFRHLVAAAADHGLEIAIDFAIQCSPDHPWLKQHRGWFDWRPDGSIKYAENPPKKYQDIVNVDFYAKDAVPDLWVALADVVMFWMAQGVRLLRVDNPHTKPLPFWQWMIATVRDRYPDAVFLAEAFTRPKVMYRLAKVGFSQSYTYFTWRETKREMELYLTELAEPGPRDFFRPHFFVNTPDINPVYLQNAPRAAYLTRAALAATLSGLWGVYNGFELCEGTPLPGREEYLDSEKYQIRVWDWDRPGNIVPEITALNRIRRANPALRSHLHTSFLPAGNDAVSVFLKSTPDRSNVLVVAISFDPNQPQETGWEFPFWLWQVDETAGFEAEDLLGGARLTWRGKYQSVRLDPSRPYAIWRIRALT